MTNPYRAPTAPVADPHRAAGSPVKAVTYGVLVDILGTLAGQTLLVFIYGIVLAAGGASAEDIESAARTVDPTSLVGLMGLAVGFAFSFLGGYVCARVVRRAELKKDRKFLRVRAAKCARLRRVSGR